VLEANHGVTFPVADAFLCLDNVGSFLDGDAVFDATSPAFSTTALPALFVSASQMSV